MITVKLTSGGQLEDLVGLTPMSSQWVPVEQVTIDAFAAVTGDSYWIHTDPARARAASTTTIAHGLLVLSLGPAMSYTLIDFSGIAKVLNYGYDRIRLISPVPSVAGCVLPRL